jgi:hypothetical protein
VAFAGPVVCAHVTKEGALRGTVGLAPIRCVLLLGGLALAGVLGAGIVATARSSASTTGPVRNPPADVLTPLVAFALSSPHPVRGTDNRTSDWNRDSAAPNATVRPLPSLALLVTFRGGGGWSRVLADCMRSWLLDPG